MTFNYRPKGVCSQQIIIELNDDVIENLRVLGGCNGNLQGISALVRGMKAQGADICLYAAASRSLDRAKAFCEAVLRRLDGDIPVLATVRAGDLGSSFLDRVRTHPKAELYHVSPEQADGLYDRLLPIVEGWNEVLKC